MIYFSNAQQVIAESIERLKSINQNKMFEHRDKLIDYYQYSNTQKYITNYFTGTLQKEFPLYTTNFTKRLINRISMVYKNPPVRQVGIDDNADYAVFLKNKDYQMKVFERIHNLLGTMLIHTHWDGQQIHYRPILRYQVALNPDNPLEVEAIIYPKDKPVDDTRQSQEDVFVYWSKDEHFLINAGGRIISVNEGNLNPYMMLPFVTIQPNTIVDEYFNEGEGADIALANQQIDISATMLQRHIRAAGGQLYVNGRVDASKIELGLNKILEIEDGTLNSVGNQVDVNSIIAGIEHQIKHICSNHHIAFDFGLTSNRSGVSIKLENLELMEAREDDADKFRMIERELYQVERQIIGVMTGRVLPEDFSVDFAEMEFPDPDNEMKQWDWWMKHGIKDKVDYIMEKDPDRFEDRDDAIKHLEERQTQRTSRTNIFSLRTNGEADTQRLPV
mgnify:FL=1